MKIVVRLHVEVNIPTNKCNVNETFDAVSKARDEFTERLASTVIEAYQEEMVRTLRSPSGLPAKKGLALHQSKQSSKKRCRCRRFKRAGYWSDLRELHSDVGSISFHPAMVGGCQCGKRITPILAALELKSYQNRTDQLLRKTMRWMRFFWLTGKFHVSASHLVFFSI